MPLLLRDCDMNRLSWTLGNFQYIDFRRDFSGAMDEMVRAIRTER
jgi:hypothetical protein